MLKSTQSALAVILVAFTLAGQVSVAVAQSETVDFELPDIDGKMHRLSDYRGSWVIVNFWATWCSPCIKEIPMLSELAKTEKPVQPVVIGIAFEEIETARLRKFMETMKMDYLILRIGEVPLIPFEPLKGMPTTFVVSPEGKIVYRHIGLVTKADLLNQLPK